MATLGVRPLSLDGLVDALRRRPLAAAAAPANHPPACIYVESNRHERTLWEPLGAAVRRRWARLFQTELLVRGLPIDSIDMFPTLTDADGVLLLWGRKTSDVLMAQVGKIESKPGMAGAPGLVAYLMPPNTATEPVPAHGWHVLRFDVGDGDAVDVVAEEEGELNDFLRAVGAAHGRRSGLAGAAAD